MRRFKVEPKVEVYGQWNAEGDYTFLVTLYEPAPLPLGGIPAGPFYGTEVVGEFPTHDEAREAGESALRALMAKLDVEAQTPDLTITPDMLD